jgi:hypothetical protein
MEDVIMLGYPNGIWDAKHNLPIIRRGVTATHAKLPLNGKPEFLIDAACFPGSSGSPVFLANIGGYFDYAGNLIFGSRVFLLGTLWGGPVQRTEGEVKVVEVPVDTKAVAQWAVPMNLGYVVRATELRRLEEAVRKAVTPSPIVQRTADAVSRNAPCICQSGKRFKNCCGAVA